MNSNTIPETKAFRPWNTDSMGAVVAETVATVTIAYDHDPGRRHTFKRSELASYGRFVDRADF